MPICSSGAEKRRLTVALSCTGSGDRLPAFAIFKGKRKLKFIPPREMKIAVQKKAWMDSVLMLRWFKSIILPYTKGRRSLLVIDSFSAHENASFLELANANSVDVAIIPGGCTSKVQPLDVSINKPFTVAVKEKWVKYVNSLVDASANPTPQDKLKTADKPTIVTWIKEGLVYLKENKPVVTKSLLVCGITNDLHGSENHLIRCSEELPAIKLPYFQEEEDNPFLDDDEFDSEEDDQEDNRDEDYAETDMEEN